VASALNVARSSSFSFGSFRVQYCFNSPYRKSCGRPPGNTLGYSAPRNHFLPLQQTLAIPETDWPAEFINSRHEVTPAYLLAHVRGRRYRFGYEQNRNTFRFRSLNAPTPSPPFWRGNMSIRRILHLPLQVYKHSNATTSPPSIW